MRRTLPLSEPVRVTVWGENRHEKLEEHVARIYPKGMHTTIAEGIVENLGDDSIVGTATLDEPEHGLSEESDEVVERVQRHVLSGMGLIVLHSGHWSKIFVRLMGTTCSLRWRSE